MNKNDLIKLVNDSDIDQMIKDELVSLVENGATKEELIAEINKYGESFDNVAKHIETVTEKCDKDLENQLIQTSEGYVREVDAISKEYQDEIEKIGQETDAELKVIKNGIKEAVAEEIKNR
jgi:hypothetical protein